MPLTDPYQKAELAGLASHFEKETKVLLKKFAKTHHCRAYYLARD